MKKRLKWIMWGVVAVALAGTMVYSSTRPLQAELLEIKPRTIEEKFTEQGKVLATWERDFYSVVGGKILAINVEDGDTVAAGDLLLAMDTRELDLKIAQLEGQLESTRGQEKQAFNPPPEARIAQQQLAVEQVEEQLTAAREEHERIALLHESGAVSKSALEEAERAVKQLELLLAQQEQGLKLLLEESSPPVGTREQFSGLQASTEAQIALLEYQREHAVLTAPENAAVRAVHVKEGEVVAPGIPLLSLFRPGEYELEVYLLGEDVRHLQPGMDVRVAYKGLSGEKEFRGIVSRIAQAAVERISPLGLVEQRVKVTVALAGDVSSLRPGYEMDATFVTRREEDRLIVPKTALFHYEDGDAVWVVRRGRAEIQSVEKGLETDDEVVIISGLDEGGLVIRNPRLEGLKAGARVKQQ